MALSMCTRLSTTCVSAKQYSRSCAVCAAASMLLRSGGMGARGRERKFSRTGTAHVGCNNNCFAQGNRGTQTHARRATGVGVRGAGKHGVEHVHEALHDMFLTEAVLLKLRSLCACVHVAAERRNGSARQAAQVLANWNCSHQLQQQLLRRRQPGDAHACTQSNGSGRARRRQASG